jgi:hypothetical protein
MRCATIVSGLAAVAVVASIATAGAAQSPGTPSPQAVKAAADATRAAQKISLEPRNGSGVTGNVALYTIGHSRTRVVVTFPTAVKYKLTLYPGSNCVDNRTATASDVALTPMNFNTSRASMSQTIVSLPLEKVRSNYVLDVRDATSNAAVATACAHLNE